MREDSIYNIYLFAYKQIDMFIREWWKKEYFIVNVEQ